MLISIIAKSVLYWSVVKKELQIVKAWEQLSGLTSKIAKTITHTCAFSFLLEESITRYAMKFSNQDQWSHTKVLMKVYAKEWNV